MVNITNKKIVDHCIIKKRCDEIADLEVEIKNLIQRGWEPYGTMQCIETGNEYPFFIQQLVIYKEI